MKIVVISDLHGNFDALSALPESGDELWVLGDLVNYGPQPSEVVDFVRAYATVVVRGNHDNAVGFNVDPRCNPRYHSMASATMRVSNAELDETAKEFLRGLPQTKGVERDGKRFMLCHAVPSDPLFGYCQPESERWQQEVESIKADYLLVGHTHTPFIKPVGQTTVVNPGSLGQPKTGNPDACYAVWQDGRFELKHFSYDLKRALERIQRMPVPTDIQQDLATVLRTGSV
ncbi:MAG: YfcE family phosphodiesterase [Candidatus Korobacteraceae bacterium]|jgi:protein phosphatase